MQRCDACGWDMLGATHACPPPWLVWREENGEHSAGTVHAYSPDGAAKRWVRGGPWARAVSHDNAHLLVCVRCTARGTAGELHRYRVTGTLEPSYSAEEIP